MVRFTPIETARTMAGCGQGWRLLLLLVVAVASRPLPDGDTPDTARILRIGGSGGSSSNNNNNSASNSSAGGYSVSFVPLFSLIANFLPKIFTRFGGTVQTSSRSLVDTGKEVLTVKEEEPCSPTHGNRWPHPSDCQQFYECQVKPDASARCQSYVEEEKSHENQNIADDHKLLKSANSCVTITIVKCPSNYVYSDAVKQCVPKKQDHSCHKHKL